MGRGLKIFLWILGILVLLLVIIGVYGFYTYKQVKPILSIAADEKFQQEAQFFFEGNCSDPNFVLKYDAFEDDLKYACKNPVLRSQIEQRSAELLTSYDLPDKYHNIKICDDVFNPDSEYSKYISELKTNCTR